MNTLHFTNQSLLLLALLFGFIFGWLLHQGKVTNYNTIINQFRMKDFTVLKVMLSAIITGGIGVLFLVNFGLATWHIRDAHMLATIIGATIFGIGMVIYGYCPGTGIAASATGSIHALIGVFGMLCGAFMYALSFDWIQNNIAHIWNLGKLTIPQLLNIPASWVYAMLTVIAVGLFSWIAKFEK